MYQLKYFYKRKIALDGKVWHCIFYKSPLTGEIRLEMKCKRKKDAMYYLNKYNNN